MRYAHTDEQLRFGASVRELLARSCPPSAVRAAWTDGSPLAGRSPERWRALAEVGLLGLLVPESAGGLGLGLVDALPALEETGRAALPEPVEETAIVVAPLLAAIEVPRGEAGGPHRALLEEIAAGAKVLTSAIEPEGYVRDADWADAVLALRDGALWLVPRAALTLTPQRSVDGARRLARIAWDPSRATSVLPDPVRTEALVAEARLRGAVAVAAQLVGLSERMLAMAVEYVRTRQQFGVPIGSFQAIKHLLAEVRIALDFTRPTLLRAAASLDGGEPDRALHVALAKARAGEAAEHAARATLQAHGAMGYSFEYDLHLYMKRAWSLSSAWGDAAFHREVLARALLDVPDPGGP